MQREVVEERKSDDLKGFIRMFEEKKEKVRKEKEKEKVKVPGPSKPT